MLFGTFFYHKMPFSWPVQFTKRHNLAYLDDLLILSCSSKEYLHDVQQVFSKSKVFKLKLYRQKCVFACKYVCYLKHISQVSICLAPDSSKVSYIKYCSSFWNFNNVANIFKPLTIFLKDGFTQHLVFNKIWYLILCKDFTNKNILVDIFILRLIQKWHTLNTIFSYSKNVLLFINFYWFSLLFFFHVTTRLLISKKILSEVIDYL